VKPMKIEKKDGEKGISKAWKGWFCGGYSERKKRRGMTTVEGLLLGVSHRRCEEIDCTAYNLTPFRIRGGI